MDDLTEKEQIENFRTWWNDYGNVVILGVVLGIAGLFGLNYYSTSKANAEIQASELYDELTGYVAEGDVEDAERVTGELESGFPESYYTGQAKLAMARAYMDSNRDEDAAEMLRQLVNAGGDAPFAGVARLRLAKVLQYQEKYEDVLALLDGQGDTGFTARYAEARGDAHVGLGQFDEARAEYLVAIADNGQTVDMTFLQLKILDLPVPEPEVAEATDVLDAVDGEESAEAGLAEASEPETP